MAECVILIEETDEKITWKLDDESRAAIKGKTPIESLPESISISADGEFDQATKDYYHSEDIEEVHIPYLLTSMKLIDFEAIFDFDELVFKDAETLKEIKRVEI